MNNTYVSFKKLFFILTSAINVYCFTMETLSQGTLTDPEAIAERQKKYTHYFSEERKNELIGCFKIHNPLFDKGFLQAYIACLTDETIVSKKEKTTYLLYKTFKYALDQILTIALLPTSYKKIYAQTCCKKLYRHLEFFEKNSDHITFTPHIMFNIVFQFAFLNDIAHDRDFYHIKNEDLQEILEKHYTIPDVNDLNDIALHKMHSTYNKLLFFFCNAKTDPDFMLLSVLKRYFGQNDTVIIPVTSKNGKIGLNTFIYCLSKGFGPVGAGNKPSTVHGKVYSAITDFIFHDLQHLFIWVSANKQSITLEYDLLVRKAFLHRIDDLFCTLITEYKKEKSQNNEERCSRIHLHIIIMFFMLHEESYPYALHSKKVKKLFLNDILEKFFEIQTANELEKECFVKKKFLTYLLFNSIDHYFLLRSCSPVIDQQMKEHNLSIKNYSLVKNNQLGLIYTEDIKNFLAIVLQNMQSAGMCFLSEYEKAFNKTMPYTLTGAHFAKSKIAHNEY